MSRELSHNAIDILDRLIIAKKAKNDSDLAGMLGVKQNTISSWRSRNSIDFQRIIAICDTPKELVYVLRGEEYENTRDNKRLSKSNDHTDSVSVPVYAEVSAAAGYGAINSIEHPTAQLNLPIEFLPHGRHGDYKIIFISGDSMEPTLCPREPIMIDFGIHSIKGAGIYVIRIDDELFVKRLDKLPDGSIRVSSDNCHYEPFIIQPDSGIRLNIVGKVILNIKIM